MPVLRLLSMTLAFLATAAPCASAAPYAPPNGKVFHGGTGGYTRAFIQDFARRSGRRPAIYQYFFTPSWRRPDARSLRWQQERLAESAAEGARTMFHLSTARGGTGGSVITPAALTRGDGDGYLIDLADAIAASGQIVYVRLMAEMNNFNNPYCAFNGDGSRRVGSHSTRAYRRAWRRASLILRGGDVAAVNVRLGRLGMPPVRTERVALPQPRVALLWVPLTAGLPHRRGNSPGDYWPGSRYVDWVGTDFYAVSQNFRGLERFYRDRRWRRKPFAFGEWGLWGTEDTRFVRRLFAWIRSHRRVRLVVNNQGALLPRYLRLRSHPRSAAELRRQVRGRRFDAYPPELRASRR
jgi:hypothetical protein